MIVRVCKPLSLIIRTTTHSNLCTLAMHACRYYIQTECVNPMVFVLHIMPLKNVCRANEKSERCNSSVCEQSQVPEWNKIEFHLCSLHSIALHTLQCCVLKILKLSKHTHYTDQHEVFFSLYKWMKYKIFNALVLHLENWYKERGRLDKCILYNNLTLN